MVWGAIAYDNRSPLLSIKGKMWVRCYIQELFELRVIPYCYLIQNTMFFHFTETMSGRMLPEKI